ncbi:hypothetical protein HOA91_06085 [Candidatus Woesearchaeota archaeon]|jgi:hypothetical protein|nr:hypothetical protein [Candidatus Woesearchaeota archaeon]
MKKLIILTLLIGIIFLIGCNTDSLIEECVDSCNCGSDSGSSYQQECEEKCYDISDEKALKISIQINKQLCMPLG